MKSGTTGITRAVSKRRKKIPTITLRLPIYWASALINGDESGLDVQDINQIDAMMAELLAQYESVHAVDVGEADFCSHHDGQRWGAVAGDCATYTFHVGATKKVKKVPTDEALLRQVKAKNVEGVLAPYAVCYTVPSHSPSRVKSKRRCTAMFDVSDSRDLPSPETYSDVRIYRRAARGWEFQRFVERG